MTGAGKRVAMDITEATRRALIERVAGSVILHADELTSLDQAIGDGDHGINMKRGFEAVLTDLDRLAAMPLPEALQAIGMTLVMKIGGASGPLYGTLFMELGKSLPDVPGFADVTIGFEAAIAAVKRRGKSDAGCKTMLDVLIPVLETLKSGQPGSAGRLPAVAAAAAEATRPMKAVRGRASFLGDRSIGHVDPGARSSALMISAICKTLEAAA
jgi:dihydroxyacetone kinase-like protein